MRCVLLIDKHHEVSSFVKKVTKHTHKNVKYEVACMTLVFNPRHTFPTAGFEVIYQTRETVFHRDIQTPRRELKIRRAAEYF